MRKHIFIIFLLCYICCSQVLAGLVDSLTAVHNKNATIASVLPLKKNDSSKYAYLKNDKQPLETVIDAHQPVDFKLQKAAENNTDVNSLSEKQLEAIGDAAMAEKLTGSATKQSAGNSTNKVPKETKNTSVTQDVDNCTIADSSGNKSLVPEGNSTKELTDQECEIRE